MSVRGNNSTVGVVGMLIRPGGEVVVEVQDDQVRSEG
jgi:hypothetical protein